MKFTEVLLLALILVLGKVQTQEETEDNEAIDYMNLLYSILKDKPAVVNGLYKQIEKGLDPQTSVQRTKRSTQFHAMLWAKEKRKILKYINKTLEDFKEITQTGCRPIPQRFDLVELFKGYRKFTESNKQHKKVFVPPVIELKRCSKWFCHCTAQYESCFPIRSKSRILHVIVFDVVDKRFDFDFVRVTLSTEDTKRFAEMAINASTLKKKYIYYENEMIVYDHEECGCKRYNDIKCPKPFEKSYFPNSLHGICDKCNVKEAEKMHQDLIEAGVLKERSFDWYARMNGRFKNDHFFCEMIANGYFSYHKMPLEYEGIETGIRNGTLHEPPCHTGPYNFLQGRCHRDEYLIHPDETFHP